MSEAPENNHGLHDGDWIVKAKPRIT